MKIKNVIEMNNVVKEICKNWKTDYKEYEIKYEGSSIIFVRHLDAAQYIIDFSYDYELKSWHIHPGYRRDDEFGDDFENEIIVKVIEFLREKGYSGFLMCKKDYYHQAERFSIGEQAQKIHAILKEIPYNDDEGYLYLDIDHPFESSILLECEMYPVPCIRLTYDQNVQRHRRNLSHTIEEVTSMEEWVLLKKCFEKEFEEQKAIQQKIIDHIIGKTSLASIDTTGKLTIYDTVLSFDIHKTWKNGAVIFVTDSFTGAVSAETLEELFAFIRQEFDLWMQVELTRQEIKDYILALDPYAYILKNEKNKTIRPYFAEKYDFRISIFVISLGEGEFEVHHTYGDQIEIDSSVNREWVDSLKSGFKKKIAEVRLKRLFDTAHEGYFPLLATLFSVDPQEIINQTGKTNAEIHTILASYLSHNREFHEYRTNEAPETLGGLEFKKSMARLYIRNQENQITI